jgi:hypothetical protein
MKSSASIAAIAPALLKAQKLMGAAKKGAANPFFKSKYADLGAVLEACKELLNENGITILQPHTSTDKGKFVVTTLLHESGEWIASETEIVYSKEGDPQAQGSAISYARRYGLQSLVSLPAEDDDGEKAMSRYRKSEPAAQPAPATDAATESKPSSWRRAKPAAEATVAVEKPAVNGSATTTSGDGIDY